MRETCLGSLFAACGFGVSFWWAISHSGRAITEMGGGVVPIASVVIVDVISIIGLAFGCFYMGNCVTSALEETCPDYMQGRNENNPVPSQHNQELEEFTDPNIELVADPAFLVNRAIDIRQVMDTADDKLDSNEESNAVYSSIPACLHPTPSAAILTSYDDAVDATKALRHAKLGAGLTPLISFDPVISTLSPGRQS